MSNKTYVYPQKTLKQARSKFKMPHQLKTSFLHSRYNLFKVYEVLPGDTFSLDVASLIRMSTPIAPIMDNITMHLAAYFVPSRLVYDNFEQLMGANKTGAWTADDNTYKIPVTGNAKAVTKSVSLGMPWEQAGLPIAASSTQPLVANALPFRAFYLIWDEFYRNQNVSAPHAIDHSSANKVLVDDVPIIYVAGIPTAGNSINAVFDTFLNLGKYADPFTKCLPEPQKHDPVAFIPEDLKVGVIPESDSTLSSIMSLGYNSSTVFEEGVFHQSILRGEGDPDVVASVGEAWNNINALRFAFQLQKFYEKDARYGSRYFEMLNGHFGVTNPDLVLQRPQFLGEMNWRINIDQVLSTAGYAASSSTTVGAPGANSVTVKKGSLFTGSFTEHGYILIVGGTRHEHTYGSKVDKLWSRSDRLDFYDPVFANIGEQPVLKQELAFTNSTADEVFGYQEAWYEYRMIPDSVTGILNPYYASSLDYWTLCDKFASAPILNADFIYEGRESIARALVTGVSGPDFIADFYFDLVAVRELPMFSIPGLADHH